MSKIEVNTVAPQCGTTLTLGESGDTVTLGTGASQSGFGRTGTVDWNTTPKTAGTFSAVSGDGFFLNTSGGVITANLPAGTAGAIVSFADYAGTWQTNKVTVVPNGSDKIGSLNENATLNTEGQSVTFVFVDSTQGWINTMDSTSNVRGSPPFICASVSGSCNTLVTAPCSANHKIATFKGPGTFTVNSVSTCAANNVVDYLVVAGGAAGGGTAPFGGTNGAGSGAGGVRFFANPSTNPQGGPAGPRNAPAGLTVTAQGYSIVVGAGGAASGNAGNPGNVSTFSTITSTGGGGGGSASSPLSPTEYGRPGGSGGGQTGGSTGNFGAGNTPPVSPSQGEPGGNPSGDPKITGAGGGFMEAGTGPRVGGAGGGFQGFGSTGVPCGSYRYFAGGGGGASEPAPGAKAGGLGGGGAGGGSPGPASTGSGTAGTINTGGGGGGGTYVDCSTGGGGGSGIVIIRYKFQ